MRRKIAVVLICFFVTGFFCCYCYASAPSVSAESAVLLEMSTGEIVYSRNADQRRPMASTTKIMTAIIALEKCPNDCIVSVSKAAVGVEGSSIYLRAGEKISMTNLLYALLLESANDAAAAIAIEVAGSVEAFAEMMNQKAAELGLSDTSFANPHGLSNENHYTTAKELALITAYALQNETFREIVSCKRKIIESNGGEITRLLLNHNRLLRQYDGAVGVKTGFTKASGRCLVSAAERNGVTLIAVTLNAPDDWRDHTVLLDYGFSIYERVNLVADCPQTLTLPVVGGKTDTVSAHLSGEASVVLKRENRSITSEVQLKRFYYAPVAQGEILGRAVFYNNGIEIAHIDIVADSGAEAVSHRLKLLDILFWLFGK